jgi:hypothetical protein
VFDEVEPVRKLGTVGQWQQFVESGPLSDGPVVGAAMGEREDLEK